jgi:uncharacterized protein (TIGR03118 family)
MARHTDPNLNGWGMDSAPDGPFCVANNSTGTATFYDRQGKPLSTVITIPTAPRQPLGPIGSPTGVVYNPTSDFVISANGRSAPARFLFDTLDGLICGWNPAVDTTHAIILVDNSTEAPFPASYTALALGKNGHGQNVLYTCDSGASTTLTNNRIDMLDGQLHVLGSFTDPSVNPQTGGTIFQVEDVGGKLLVTVTGFTEPFGGVVDVFNADGRLLTPQHFAANAPGQGPLAAPWGIALAPADFGRYSNDLLIGNSEDVGNINAFDPAAGAFLGPLARPNGAPLVIKGVWGMEFAASSPGDSAANALYFTAGFTLDDPAGNGLFGVIQAVGKDPATAAADAPAVQPFAPGTTPASGALGPGVQQSRSDAPPALVLSVQPGQPASAPTRLASRPAHRLAVDAVFADLDVNTLGTIPPGETVSMGPM